MCSSDLAIFGQGLWTIGGSIVAFLVGQLIDVSIFHRIRAMTGVPPVRPGTRLAVGVVVHDGRICLTTLCDRRTLGDSAPGELSEMIHAEVEACAAAL